MQTYIERGWSPDRVFAAPNALDLDVIDAARANTLTDVEALDGFRRSKAIADSRLALFVSRLDPPRRVDVLLEAISLLRSDFPKLKLAIVGDGPTRAEIEACVRSLGLEDHVQLAGAVYDEAELARWFCCAEVFAFPSYMGLSALHALAYGLPIITGNERWEHGPEVEAVIDGKTGLLFTHNDPRAMADAMGRLLRDPALRAEMSHNARAIARERYSMSAMIDAFENAIRMAASLVY